MADISTVAQIYDNAGAEITASRVGANAYKFVDPASQFSTRKLRFVKIVNGGDLTSGDFITTTVFMLMHCISRPHSGK